MKTIERTEDSEGKWFLTSDAVPAHGRSVFLDDMDKIGSFIRDGSTGMEWWVKFDQGSPIEFMPFAAPKRWMFTPALQ